MTSAVHRQPSTKRGTPPRNYSQNTARSYLSTVRDFAKHFNKPPDQMGPDEIRQYQAYLIGERKLEARTVGPQHSGAPVFLRQDAQTAIPTRGGSVPEATASFTDHF
jgi:hypothetical protein